MSRALRRLILKGGASFRKLNNDTRHKTQGSKPKRTVRNVAVGQVRGEKGNPTRYRLCVTSFRCRLIDPDNLCPKYFIDALRYLGVIEDDTAAHVELTITQSKVATAKDERTEIEITKL